MAHTLNQTATPSQATHSLSPDILDTIRPARRSTIIKYILPKYPILALACLASVAHAADEAHSKEALAALKTYLTTSADHRPAIATQPFAATPLTKSDAQSAQQLLGSDYVAQIRTTRAAEVKDRLLTSGDLKMPFFYTTFGDKPAGGRSLFISMHGGGNAPASLNDSQYENQKHLYKPPEGVYLAPRAPTNTWMLWHESHIDTFFDRLIEDLIAFEDVNPNRVYLMGYSAGGDGVYQLAPRMADRFAAASMMAGHPNDASPLGLRNLPFSIHVGALDNGFDRNKVAMQWEQKLAALRENDLQGYIHWVKLYDGKAHWMDGQDAAAIPWMMQFTRNPIPAKIVWKQGNAPHDRFYWLALDAETAKSAKGKQVIATLDPAPPLPSGSPAPAAPTVPARGPALAANQPATITLETADYDKVTVRLSDAMLDLDKPLTIIAAGKPRFTGMPNRTIATLSKTLHERGDPAAVYAAEMEIGLKP
ncbi:MAG TPA: alpha/beta hydrolase [Phycisphaerae bacterium]|nr:alpha/beta hydrolase [Phycisphaerae bacterium]